MSNKITEIDYDKLLFDPKNPRLPSSIQDGNGDDSVLEYMLDKGKVTDLMLSISESGFFDGEPLLIYPAKGKPGFYYVAEGNRRLSAIKLLHKPEIAPIKKNTVTEIVSQASQPAPVKIPCIIYEDRKDTLDSLGYRHITGIDEWNSLMKAKYLRELYDFYIVKNESNESDVYKILGKKIGTRSDVVKKLLNGYKIYKEIEKKDFYNISELNEQNFSFSLLTTALSYANIKEFTEKEDETIIEDNLENLTKWIFKKNSEDKTVLGESRNLKVLNSVVASPVAVQKLKNGSSLDEARLFSSHPKDTFLQSLNLSYKRLGDAKSVTHHINDFEQSDLELIKDIVSVLRDINAIVKSKIDSSNFEL